jgi:hypothetical protein
VRPLREAPGGQGRARDGDHLLPMQDPERGVMLKDKWFHTREPETMEISYQGHILDYIPPRLVLVQLLSWFDGGPTIQKLLEVTDLWDFYETSEMMVAAYEAEAGRFDLSHRRP